MLCAAKLSPCSSPSMLTTRLLHMILFNMNIRGCSQLIDVLHVPCCLAKENLDLSCSWLMKFSAINGVLVCSLFFSVL